MIRPETIVKLAKVVRSLDPHSFAGKHARRVLFAAAGSAGGARMADAVRILVFILS